MISLSMENLFEDGGEEYDAVHVMLKEEGKNSRKFDNQADLKYKPNCRNIPTTHCTQR